MIDFRANKPSDVVSTLVSIYESKDLFVKELQVLLAQRLLAVTDGNYEKEVKPTLRLALETSHSLVVQIAQELGDSQNSLWRSTVASLRGNAQGHDGFQANRSACAVSESREWAIYLREFSVVLNIMQSVMHPTIISRHFWPQFQSSKIQMPGQLREYVVVFILNVPLSPRAVEFKRHTHAISPLLNPTRNCVGSHTSGASISRYNCKTAQST